MKSEEGATADETATDSITGSIRELQSLLDQLNHAVSQQQHTLITVPQNSLKQAALRQIGDISRILLYQRSLIDELQHNVEMRQMEQIRSLALQEVAATINSSLELDQVLNQVMDVFVRLTSAERSLLLLLDEENEQLEVQVARNMDRETIEHSESFQISRSIVRRVAETGDAVVTMNAQEDERFSAQESIINYRLRSILCVPLKIRQEITGVIYADNRVASGIFGENDRDLLSAFANQAAVAIDNARLFREIRNNLAEITEMKNLMDNVFASIDGGVITIDEADRIALFNRAAAVILGVPAEAVLFQDYQTAFKILGLPVELMVSDVKSSGATLSMEVDIKTEHRPNLVTLNLTVSPLRDVNKETLGVAMVLDDVSELKRLESVRRYLPPTLVDRVRDLDAAQRPQQRILTVLFADLRGFTGYSEARDPGWLIETINGYFALAVKAITHYQGFTDKFMGDAVMALFNTPINPQPDHISRALQAALMIQESLVAYRQNLSVERRLHFGIGIHTGQAVVGNVGSDLRKDYSAVGDAVNLAKRLQEVAPPDEIIISQEIYDQAREWITAEKLEPVRVKGRQATEQIYSLLGVGNVLS